MQKAIKRAVKGQPDIRVLHEGSVATVRISSKARKGTLQSDQRVKFFQFPVHVAGRGCINIFLHSDNSLLVGEKVICHVKVLEKIFPDGRTYIHVDLFPAAEGVKATKQLFLVRYTDVTVQDHWKVFETGGAQGYGMVILAGLTDVFPDRKESTVDEIPTPAAVAKVVEPVAELGKLLSVQ